MEEADFEGKKLYIFSTDGDMSIVIAGDWISAERLFLTGGNRMYSNEERFLRGTWIFNDVFSIYTAYYSGDTEIEYTVYEYPVKIGYVVGGL